MSLSKLKLELVEMGIDVKVEYIEEAQSAQYYLSEAAPANVMDGKIHIINNLSDDTKIQALAHEYGHLLIKERGIISFEPIGDGPFDYLILELNNALSHKFIINVLEQKFGISSDFHLKLLVEGLNKTKDIIKNSYLEKEILFGIGLKLYDIAITVPNKKKEIEDILAINKNIELSFQAANTHLKNIHLDSSVEEQMWTIEEYLNDLKLNIDDLKN